MEDETESVITLFYKFLVYLHLEYSIQYSFSPFKKRLKKKREREKQQGR